MKVLLSEFDLERFISSIRSSKFSWNNNSLSTFLIIIEFWFKIVSSFSSKCETSKSFPAPFFSDELLLKLESGTLSRAFPFSFLALFEDDDVSWVELLRFDDDDDANWVELLHFDDDSLPEINWLNLLRVFVDL